MVNKQSSTLPVSEEELKGVHAKYPEVGVKTAASTVLQLVSTLPGGGLPHQTVWSVSSVTYCTLSSLLLQQLVQAYLRDIVGIADRNKVNIAIQ